jgi:hypothetical protein
MKRELLYIAATVLAKLDMPRTEMIAKLRHLRASEENEPLLKTVLAHLRGAL